MSTYTPIVFLHDYQDETVADYLAGKLTDGEMVDYLAQWDYGDGEEQAAPSAGTADQTVEKDGYALSFNFGLGYAGLDRINAE